MELYPEAQTAVPSRGVVRGFRPISEKDGSDITACM
jgi:hypothetical protein